MAQASPEGAPRPLPRDNPFRLMAAGRRAFGEVPRLKRFLALGFALLYGVSFVVGLVGVGLIYFFIVQPLSADLGAWSAGEGFWAGLLSGLVQGLLWIGQAVLLTATVVLSFLVALSMMGVWFDALAARIIAHRRGRPPAEQPFRVGEWARGIGKALLDSLWLLILAVLALVVGFVPVIGPILVVVLEGYLLGREVRDPYLTVRAEEGTPAKQLRRGLMWWTVQTGLVPFVLALIPIAGWVLLPVAMVYLVAGFAWRGEEAHAQGAPA